MTTELQRRLYELVSSTFDMDISEIHDDRGPHDIQAWDSIGQLNLILQVENEFGVTFDIEDVFGFFTIGDVYRSLQNKTRVNDDSR